MSDSPLFTAVFDGHETPHREPIDGAGTCCALLTQEYELGVLDDVTAVVSPAQQWCNGRYHPWFATSRDD